MRLINQRADGEAATSARVLVVSIDDGLFGCHLDWVEAVYEHHRVRLHAVRGGNGRARRFVLHGRDAAAVVDLREILGLQALLGEVHRAGYLMVRSGAALAALPIDACVGVRQLDPAAQPPIPTRVVRDGGLPLGHLLTLDGRPLTVLDPNRLLDSALRDALAPLQARARAFQGRQAKIDALWEEIRREPSTDRVRALARLCGRSGRARTAGAARRVLEHMEHNGSPPDGHASEGIDRLVCELVQRQRERSSGALLVDTFGDAPGGAILIADGRVLDANCAGIEGRAAFARLLGTAAAAVRFAPGDAARAAVRIGEDTIALTIAALEALPGERVARAR